MGERGGDLCATVIMVRLVRCRLHSPSRRPVESSRELQSGDVVGRGDGNGTMTVIERDDGFSDTAG